MHVIADVFRGDVTSRNVIAESPGGDPNNVVMAGAHLDSVAGSPGINDNGSGAAMLLETAVQLEGYTPSNTLRFAWWGAEESGLVGSDTYLTSLSAAEVEAIALYLGLHMVGSPNYVRFIHDGDQFTSSPGSSAIEETLRKHFQREGLPVEEEVFTGGSIPLFEATNIPAGGLFGGAERIKTPEQALVYGGTAGEQYDPCFHLACDTFPNVSLSALDEFSDAAAWTIFKFSRSTESVNGVP